MIEIKVITEPIANVDTPETPCPIVQPKESTPPIPIKIPPIICLKKSCLFANHSILKLLLNIEYTNEPAIVDNNAATPNVKKKLSNILLVNKSVSPIGFMKVNDCTPTAGYGISKKSLFSIHD